MINLEFLEPKTFFKTKLTLKKFSVSKSKVLELNTNAIGSLKFIETLGVKLILLIEFIPIQLVSKKIQGIY
jgi:hypothetical protein